MIRVLIFSGGTGSIALQTGLYKLYGKSVKTDIIMPTYNNGKSTNKCWNFFDREREPQICKNSLCNSGF